MNKSQRMQFKAVTVLLGILFLVLLDIPFTLLENAGIWLIYQIGDSLRYILALSWKVIINCSLDSKLLKKHLPLSYLIIIYALDFSSVTFIQGQIFVTVYRGRKSIILMKTTLEFSVPT